MELVPAQQTDGVIEGTIFEGEVPESSNVKHLPHVPQTMHDLLVSAINNDDLVNLFSRLPGSPEPHDRYILADVVPLRKGNE